MGAFLSLIALGIGAASLAGLVVWVYRKPRQIISGDFTYQNIPHVPGTYDPLFDGPRSAP